MNFCPECKETELYRDKFLTVCPKCGNILEEHLQFEEKYSETDEKFKVYNCKVSRWKSILFKIEQQNNVVFDSLFVDRLSSYVKSFINNFDYHSEDRQNMISYQHLIHRFCEKYGYDKYTPYFKLNKTVSVIEKNDEIIEKINRCILI